MLSFAFIHVFKGAKKTLNVQLKKLYWECVNMKSLSLPNVPWSLKGVARIFQKGEGLTMSNGGTHQFRHLSVESLFLKKKA